MKYSFIVPVYNGEIYIERCLSSLLNQTYDNFEIIIINDGSTDKSLSKLKSYAKKNKQIRVFSTVNKGVSSARNYGIKKSTGDYIVFVDIDDLVNKDMLFFIQKAIEINGQADLIKYKYLSVDEFENIKEEHNVELESELLNGPNAFVKLVEKKIPFDMNCIYAFKSIYFRDNQFEFETGRYHEDFGLIPFMVFNAKDIILINKILYYYIQTDNSITRNDEYDKKIIKFNDILFHFDSNYQSVKADSTASIKNKKLFFSYIANAVILRYKELKKEDRLVLKNELIKRNIVDLLLSDTLGRKLKKIMYKKML